MIYVIKRDGVQQIFDSNKIKNAILKAFKAVDGLIMLKQKQKMQQIILKDIAKKKLSHYLLKKFKIQQKMV